LSSLRPWSNSNRFFLIPSWSFCFICCLIYAILWLVGVLLMCSQCGAPKGCAVFVASFSFPFSSQIPWIAHSGNSLASISGPGPGELTYNRHYGSFLFTFGCSKRWPQDLHSECFLIGCYQTTGAWSWCVVPFKKVC
jgi:hypothetical protein